MKKPELVVAAGDWESLTAALRNGADAVYFGTKQFNLRINAKSFELSEIPKVVKCIHEQGACAYLTLNAIFFQNELQGLKKIIKQAKAAGVDAIICWDLAVIEEARAQGIPVHLSTQASVSNFASLKAYSQLGVKRVVLARECTLDMIKDIKRKIKEERLSVKIETFVHGALCVSLSGRCFISEYLFGHSANRGDCYQPCRREYTVRDREEGYELAVEDGYVLSPKDLCTVDILDVLIDAGIDAFKIEGRTRPCDYIARTTRVYREAIDACTAGILTTEKKETLLKELATVYNRGFSHGFYYGKPRNDLSVIDGSQADHQKEYVGKVIHYFKKISVAEVLLRSGSLSIGDTILFTGKKTGTLSQCVGEMEVDHARIEKGEKGSKVAIKTEGIVRVGDKAFLIRK